MNLDAVKHYKVLLVGDSIIDKYCYVTPIGKSIKDPIISTRFEREEEFKGGVWAAAAHLIDFCAVIDVVSGNGTMVNTRFIDQSGMRKLFTLHTSTSNSIADQIARPISEYDVVIITDFGHGALGSNLIDDLSNEAKFLAVNTQTNSQNYGFNVITKYDRADLVVLDELEARLATHDNHSRLENVILELGFENVIVTRGSDGTIGYDGKFYSEPAKADRVIDTLGAGDAVLAIASPFAAAGFHMRDLVKIGNAAGAVKVGILGHQQHVTRAALERQLLA